MSLGFIVDIESGSTNILFILSGAFVGLENIISRRIGKGVSPNIEIITIRITG